MALIVQENGLIELIQGDSGEVGVDGLATDKNYRVFFGVRDAKRKHIGIEPYMDSNNSPSVIISIPSALTDLLEVGKDDEYTDYYYGFKVCDLETGYENTLLVANGKMGEENILRVYPKKVEGLNNG